MVALSLAYPSEGAVWYFTCSTDFYLPSRVRGLEGGGGGDQYPVVLYFSHSSFHLMEYNIRINTVALVQITVISSFNINNPLI
jgi:hypothetical protein